MRSTPPTSPRAHFEIDNRFHFPDNPFMTRPTLPERWESWQRFWAEDDG